MSRAMKDSGMEWIGEVPADWEILRIQRIGKLTSSGIDKTVNEDEQCVRIINYTDVYGNPTGELAEKDYMEVTAPTWKVKEHQVKVGDVIFTPSSETIEDIGVAAVVIEPLPNTAFSYHVLRLSVKVDIVIKYRKYLFNNHFLQSHFSSRATGSIRKTLNRNDFKTANLLIPPLEEQVNIASFLDSAILQIFKLVNLQEQSIFELQAYKQSIITEAVTKGLDPDVPMKDSGVDWIGEIPAYWTLYKHRSLVKSIKSGRSVNGSSYSAINGEIGVLKTSCVYGDTFIPIENKAVNTDEVHLVSCPVTAKSLIVSRMNTAELIGSCGYVEKSFNNLFLPDRLWKVEYTKEVSTKYLWYFLQCEPVKGFLASIATGTSSSMKNITQSQFLSIPIPMPDVQTQNSIVRKLDMVLSKIHDLIKLKQSKIEALKEYKQSLVYECVTGKRDCREGSHADA